MEIGKLVASLHPLERKAVPVLSKCSTLKELMEVSGLSEAEAMRALQWLENKNTLKIYSEVDELVTLDSNGKEYIEKGLPERRFLEAIRDSPLNIGEIGKAASLSEEEVTVCLGEEQEEHVFDTATIVSIPPNLKHCPVTVRNVSKPLVFLVICTAEEKVDIWQ